MAGDRTLSLYLFDEGFAVMTGPGSITALNIVGTGPTAS